MKKWLLSLVVVSLFVGSITVFAAEKTTQPPANQAPITSAKPAEITITTDTKTSGEPFICPMMPGAGSGNVYFEKKVVPFNENNVPNGQKFFKFRFNNNQGNCCNRPRVFRWIGMGIKFIAFLLFWILLIVLMVVIVRWLLKPHHHFSSCCHHDGNSMNILRDRYAKGEITAEQFEEMKAKLNQ